MHGSSDVERPVGHDFNGTGKVTTTFTNLFGNVAGQAYGLAIQSDNKIVVVGDIRGPNFLTEFDWGMIRYNTNGTLDTTFGTGGMVTTDWFGLRDQAYDVAIQPNGFIVVAGYARTATRSDNFAVARFDANGNLDSTFGVGGKVNTDVEPAAFVSQDHAHSVSIHARWPYRRGRLLGGAGWSV